MEKVLENPSEGELPKRKGKFNYIINLIVETFPKTPIILWRLNDQAFIKDYLNSMLRKNIYKSTI